MGDVSAVIVDGASRLGCGLGEALDVPYLRVDAERVGASEDLVANGRLVWIHVIPASADMGGSADSDGTFGEAALLVRSACVARRVAETSDVPLVIISVLPARGLMIDHGASDMAAAAMDSLMRVEVGAWSDAGDHLLSIVYAGLNGRMPATARAADELVKRVPMQRLGTLEQLADADCFAGSERAAYITGTTLRVDGRWNAYSWSYPARTI